MKNLTKVQWITILITVISSVFSLVLSDANVFGLDVKWLSLIGIFKIGWDLYVSFSAQDVANFANNENAGVARKSGRVTKGDVKAWANE